MGLAFDTIVTKATNPGAGPAAFAPVPGDVLTVRNFPATDKAYLLKMIRRGGTVGMARVRSALMADNISGLQFFTGESPSVFMLPGEVPQNLYAQDNLIVEGSGGAAETDVIALGVYYTNLLGGSARLHSLADIKPLVTNLKGQHVAVAASAVAGNWSDTAIFASENALQANTDYAVLGYVTSAALGVVGIKGQDTGNLRVAGPGTTLTEDTSDYFVRLSQRTGLPCIPVINSANGPSTFVSVADSAASTASDITLVLAELSQNLPN